MEHAWLDSLSEDWVSQPRSDSSAIQLPPLKDTEATKTRLRETPSRIPRRALGSQPQLSAHDSSFNVLNERNTNDINISSQRITRPSQNSKIARGTFASRSVSGSTSESVVHNTVQHKSSPGRQQDTPEWKRRLVHGDLEYGEQRDLFCSAAAGLQDMFKPPAASGDDADDEEHQGSSMMPSSPPSYPQRIASNDFEPDLSQFDEMEELEDLGPLFSNDVTPSPSPRRTKRDIKYKLNVDDSGIDDLPSPQEDDTPSRQRDGIYRDESCLSAPSDANGSVRKISGQSVIRNEDFSPILIGKQSDMDGNVDFAPIELPADRLKQKLEALRINQTLLDPAVDPRTAFDASNQDAFGNVEDTEEYGTRGGFLNLQRGGRSGDGSFRFRDLSPGLNVDTSGMLAEESLQASTPKQYPSIRTEVTNPYQSDYFNLSPALPRAPFTSPDKKQISAGRSAPSAGSPLKLFGPYDTFTNQTLLRRISQFEEGMSGTPSRQSSGSPNPHDQSNFPVSDRFDAMSSPVLPTPGHKLTGGRSFSRFGAGDLEGYEFSEEISHLSQEDAVYSDKENDAPQSPALQPVDQAAKQAERVASPHEELDLLVRRRRNKSTSSSGSKHRATNSVSSQAHSKSLSPAKGAPVNVNTPKRDSGSEGKRPRTSPSKDPTPKRRRTLHRSDIAFGRENLLEGVESASRDMQSFMAKKRKDARPGEFELANPSVLAMRTILRPRSPTPSRGSSLRSDPNLTVNSEDDVTNDLSERSPIRALREETLDYTTDGHSEVERKPSIRTQDFVHQAAQIMAMIRNQVRPPGLSSVEESEAENGTPEADDFDDSYQESTKEPLSRPPSREGKPMSRLPQRQEDPELIDRLKKYQEVSDMGDLITLSMRSMGMVREAILADQEVEREIEEAPRNRPDLSYYTEDDVISDPPNIRLTTGPAHDGSLASPTRSYSQSSGGSTNRTYRTGSSHGSEIRKTIMPESVSHLIPDRVGSMYLDKQNNIWIKKKEMPARQPMNILPSDSDDDPFASIPDLSVDLTREMQNLAITSPKKANAVSSPNQPKSPTSPSRRQQSARGFMTLSPNGQLGPNMAALAREEFEKLDARVMEDSEIYLEDSLQEESSLHDDRTSSTPSTTTKKRNLTITFSSPVASFIQDVQAEDLDNLEDDPELPSNHLHNSSSPKKSPGFVGVGKSALKNSGHGSARNNNAITPRSGPAFVPRPVSRIDEQDEESTIEIPIDDQRQISLLGDTSLVSHKTPDGRRASLSFLVNHTPSNFLPTPADDSMMIGQNVGKLSLSPLSEFTIHNPDSSFGFEVSYVMGRRHAATGGGSKKVMSMTIRELVDKLSEVEPYEPYWEDITELDLHEKRLGSLHMLDQFCGKLVTLDASKNALGHLDGVPPSVRQLKVSQNMLTELTSWDHLLNLQYVDISGNEVKSLSALRGLVHLRSIKADNNQLTSLDGLDTHDGLLTLRARHNLIEEVDFARVQMERLTELDLEGNQITCIRNFAHAPAMSRLKLSKNKLASFTVPSCIKGLRHLDLSDNQLTCVDVSNMPDLQTLHADRNRITELTGFNRARKLDSLSLREQRADRALDLGFLSSACEVRKLFLSGNYLGTFEPKVDFLNLQLLELANCGIQALPDNLGQLMPNLRTLNLNFNAVRDLEPLRFIPRLKKLLVAGNRLADSTQVTELLIEFPHLTQLDLRDNPITIGFYAPMQMMVPTDRNRYVDPFMLPDADVERDELFSSRLDQPTKLRRRLHQIVFAASCRRLRKLDGLGLDRETVLVKDAVFQALVAEGLLPDETLVGEESSPCKDATAEGETMGTMRSSRWNAEDSFA
ncbi:Septation initiation network scaffold cdc11 [Fusarium heterosporum]|uniref:Septation initiation network scaffold cdc11 n=1 Tax=Fusarium heterosporum TaxID=42747 RepID=A0A8H5U0N8_FUSHE|nr:Septation initiation network scaffold cdc11 [Fusarium heterosporum]